MKRPSEIDGRKTFQVLRCTNRNGKRSYEKIESERLRAINSSLLSGLQDETACEFQVKEVVADLQKIERRSLPRIVHNEENHRIFQMYWDKEYSARELIDAQAAQNRLRRAIDAVGMLSLYSASKIELQRAVNSKYRDNRQRDVVASLNQLLAFIGRGVELARRPEIVGEVQYLNENDFISVRARVADPLDRLLQSVGFYSGLRQGEIFALNSESANGAQFFSQHQLDRELSRRHTKRRLEKRRRIYILPGGENYFREWANLSPKIKLEMRNRRHAEILSAACKEEFPDRTEKHIVFHDLRHSYAIYLVSRGVNLTQVAQCLNNSVAVCEKYYSGFLLKNETIEAIERTIGPVVER